MRESWSALHQFDGSARRRVEGGDLAEFYPLLKLGSPQAVDHFGEQVAVAVVAALEAVPGGPVGPWRIAAPPVWRLPSAANLLVPRVAATVARRLPLVDVSQVELRRAPLGELLGERHYGARRLRGRRDYMVRTAGGWQAQPGLAGAKVVFINDARVTGTQERYQRQYFDRTGVAMVHWQYIVEVVNVSAHGAAAFEEQLNRPDTVGPDLLEVVQQPGLQPTTKLVWRLGALADADLARLLQAMTDDLRAELLNAIGAESTSDRSTQHQRFIRLARVRGG